MRVFISRELAADSAFRRQLESRGITVTGLALVRLTALPMKDIPTSEWIFFSSKNAVHFFFQQMNLLQPTNTVCWAAIGPATAKALLQYQPDIQFTGTGDPEETARLFAEKAAGMKVLFPGARHSREGVQRFLPPDIHCITLEIYDNHPVVSPAIRAEDILVFTSPLSALAYFSCHTLLEKQQVIAIGKSTFSTIKSYGVERISMASATTESALADAVLRFYG